MHFYQPYDFHYRRYALADLFEYIDFSHGAVAALPSSCTDL